MMNPLVPSLPCACSFYNETNPAIQTAYNTYNLLNSEYKAINNVYNTAVKKAYNARNNPETIDNDIASATIARYQAEYTACFAVTNEDIIRSRKALADANSVVNELIFTLVLAADEEVARISRILKEISIALDMSCKVLLQEYELFFRSLRNVKLINNM